MAPTNNNMIRNEDELKRKLKDQEGGRREQSCRKRSRNTTSPTGGPRFLEHITLSPNGSLIARDDFLETFRRYQIAYIPNARDFFSLKGDKGPEYALAVSDILGVLQKKAAPEDHETWTQETWVADEKDDKRKEDVPGDFLKEECKDKRGYCSFILQHNKLQHEEVLNRLPFADLPVSSSITDSASKEQKPLQVTYGPGLWIFFGRNSNGKEALQGRVEHTDSIQHDGTWHYQMSGIKEWHVRPTAELLERMLANNVDDSESNSDSILSSWKEEQDRGEKDDNTRLTIRCQQGDILVINTRLWWHSTTLPVQPTVSLSYARDIYLNKDASSDISTTNPASMTNVDGLYAANDIEAGTIIFRESEMPDCELHRAKENANCEVVELEDGEGAIVSSRPIKSGEFFCILESDDDDEGEFEEVEKGNDDD